MGVIVTDFWICRRRALDIRQLYKKHGVHSFSKGFNIRAFIAFICGIVPDLPGLAHACGQTGIPKGAIYLYSLSWLVATVVSSFVYWVSFKIVPFEVSPTQEMYMDGFDASETDVVEVPETGEKKQFEA